MKPIGYLCTTAATAVLLACSEAPPPAPEPSPEPELVTLFNDKESQVTITSYVVTEAGKQEPSASGSEQFGPGRRSFSFSLAPLGAVENYEVRFSFRPEEGAPSCSKRPDGCSVSMSFTSEQAESGEPITLVIPPPPGE